MDGEGTPAAVDRRLHTVQLERPLSDRDDRSLAGRLADHPWITLRAWGSVPDLDFLRFFPQLQRFAADSFSQEPSSFEGLPHLRPDLHALALGSTERRLSLAPLAHLTGLRRLFLQKQATGIDVVSGLTALRSLTLREITVPDLSVLLPLPTCMPWP